MSDEQPNMTATEIANAQHPPAPGDGLLKWMIDREMALLVDHITGLDALTSSRDEHK